jgi:hypothetical protein
VSLHVAENVEKWPPDSLHPTQGALAVLKLVSQPPLQLLLAFSSRAIFSNTEPGGADGLRAVDDGIRAADDIRRRDVLVLATGPGLWGFSVCFEASIVTAGSWEAGLVVVCDTAGPHNTTVDKTATAEGTAKLEDNFMAISSRGRTCRPYACKPQLIAEILSLDY